VDGICEKIFILKFNLQNVFHNFKLLFVFALGEERSTQTQKLAENP
jgi:hypothetical protein